MADVRLRLEMVGRDEAKARREVVIEVDFEAVLSMGKDTRGCEVHGRGDLQHNAA